MLKRFSFILSIILMAFGLQAQQDPLQIEFESSGDPTPGATYDVNVRVSDFDQLLGAQFVVDWDSTVLEIDTLPFISQDLPDLNAGAFSLPEQTASMTKGQLRCSWFSFSFVPQTLPDDHLLFTMRFNVVGEECDSTDIDVTSIPPNFNIEISDANFDNIGAVWEPLNAKIPGTDCAGGGTGGDGDEVMLIFQDVTAMPGERVCMPLTVNNFDTIEACQSSLMWDASVLSFVELQNFGLPGLNAGLFNANNAANGMMSFVWFDNTGQNPVTLPDNSTIVELCFDVIGDLGDVGVVKASNMPVLIEFSSPQPIGKREFSITEGSVTVAQDTGGQEFSIIADTVTVDLNAGEVCVDFTTMNFTNIAGMQYTLQWDENILAYNRVEAVVPAFSSTFNPADNDKLRYVWTNPTGVGLDLADGTVIYRVCFDLVGDCETSTPLQFIGEPARPIEITDGTFTSLPSNLVNMQNGLVNIVCNITLEADINDVRCNGESNGSINLMITGGMPPYDIDWEWSTGTTSQTGQTQNSLLVGRGADTYTATVTDSNGDTNTGSFVINQPDPLEIDVVVNGNMVEVNVSGGNGGETLEFSPDITDLNNVPDGTYTVLVTDSRGCQETEIFVVGSACSNPVEVSTVVFSAVCGDDGRIEVTCDGGSGNFNITSDPTLTLDGNAFINVPVGMYTITCEDIDEPECSSSVMVEVLQGSPVDLEIDIQNITNVSCTGDLGSFDVEAQGGCTPYIITYTFNGGASQPYDPNGEYEAGDYEVLVTDANGTAVSESFTIEVDSNGDLEITFEVTNAPCTGMMGEATFTVTGVCGELSCELFANNGTNGQACGLVDNGDGTFTGAYPIGTHTIEFTDDMGGSASQQFTIGVSPDALTASVASVGNGAIDINVSGGAMPYQFIWQDPNGDDAGDTEDLSGLTISGMYSVTIIDANGCSFALTVTLVGEGEISLNVDPVGTPFDGFATPCAQGDCMGAISGLISGGTAPYTVTITDDAAQDLVITVNEAGSFDFNELCPGSYQVSAEDSDGDMVIATGTYIINAPDPITISEDQVQCPDDGQNNGFISATVTGGTNLGYIYFWTPESGDPIPGPVNENLGPGMYTLEVEDSNGCTGQATFDLITNCIDTDCFVGKRVITPNGDGANDIFTISCADNNDYSLRVFDRWGETVYSSNNYMNDWNGEDLSGEPLVEGAYYWVLDTGDRVYQGTVTLLRN